MPANAGWRSAGLPSIPWSHFFHIDSSELSDQFLTASAYWLPEFGEWAAALQVIESILPRTAVLSTRPAGTTFTWTRDRQHVNVWTVHTWNKRSRLDKIQYLPFYTFYWSKFLLVCSGKNFFVKSFSLPVFSLLKITWSLRKSKWKCFRKIWTMSCWKCSVISFGQESVLEDHILNN